MSTGRRAPYSGRVQRHLVGVSNDDESRSHSPDREEVLISLNQVGSAGFSRGPTRSPTVAGELAGRDPHRPLVEPGQTTVPILTTTHGALRRGGSLTQPRGADGFVGRVGGARPTRSRRPPTGPQVTSHCPSVSGRSRPVNGTPSLVNLGFEVLGTNTDR